MIESRFKWLLKLLPGAFREEHERDIVRIWRDELREARAGDARAVWCRALADTLRVAPREHVATWARNIRIATRALWKARAFTIASVLTLALGTGATAAMFSLINAVLLRPLPWHNPEEVGLVWAVSPNGDRTWLSVPELDELRTEIGSLASVAGFTDLRFAYAGKSVAREIEGLAVSNDLFRVLGVAPILGRDFARDEDQRAAPKVAVLSDPFWRSEFGGDARVIGQQVRLNERTYTIIGVLPPAFEWLPASSVIPGRVDVWVALEPHLVTRDRTIRYLHAIGRLRTPATFASATAELRSYARRAAASFGRAYPGGDWQFEIVSFKGDVLQGTRTALLVLFGLVLLVLLMACTNVAHLLLARGDARRAELAIRTALGARPSQLVGELVAQALVLATPAARWGWPSPLRSRRSSDRCRPRRFLDSILPK